MGCDDIFTDHGVSGAEADRPGLNSAQNALQNGDMLVVWRLDRLGRSLLNLITLVNDLGSRGVEFRSVMEAIDTSSSGGRLTFHIMAAMANLSEPLSASAPKQGWRLHGSTESASVESPASRRNRCMTRARRSKAVPGALSLSLPDWAFIPGP
jgi:hypothetical protein